MKKNCNNCGFNIKKYCQSPNVMLWDRGGYADFGVVSTKNYPHTNCAREGKFVGVQFPTIPKYWKEDKNA